MQRLIFNTEGKNIGSIKNGQYYIISDGNILVPDIPVGKLFEREDGTVIHILKCNFLGDTYDINIAKGKEIENVTEISAKSLLKKIISEKWKLA
jgi:hypothetical protein